MKAVDEMNPIEKFRNDEAFQTLFLTVLAGIFLIAGFFKWFPDWPFDPAWIAILLCGTPIVYGAIRGLILFFDVTADVLVAIALIAAVFIGEYFAAGEVAFIMQLGKVLEDHTAGKTRKSLQALIRLTPQKATLRTGAGDREIAVSEVKAEDLLLIRPGEAIPVDGLIVKGSTSVNQAVMTGESVPVDRFVGDEVYQGTVNQHGVIEIRATRLGEDSALNKLIRLVEEAELNRAPIVRIADKWARLLVPVALGCTVLIWILSKDIYRAVAALVVFCPCSLILATPAAMMASIGNATKNGVLIKSGAAIEAMSKVDVLVMDKTGTLTYGDLQVADLILLDTTMDQTRFLSLVASAEKFSEHPLGKAVVAYVLALGADVGDPETFDMQTGKGVYAKVDGHDILVGEKMVIERCDMSPETLDLISKLRGLGRTVLPVAIDGKVSGIISVADALRQDAGVAIASLRQTGLSDIMMLTGDHKLVADSIAQKAGISKVFASQLPHEKVGIINQLKSQGHTVAMIGDGVNDAPALAAASVGIVMGAIGSDVAIETADIALMSDDLSKLSYLIKLSQRTKRLIAFNISVGMLLNFGAIIIAGMGLLTPVSAALVHNVGSVFVVVNASRLLNYEET